MLTTDGRGSPEYAQALHFNPVVCWSKELDKYMHASFLYCWNTVVHTFASIKPTVLLQSCLILHSLSPHALEIPVPPAMRMHGE
jgi:hypothetical protein